MAKFLAVPAGENIAASHDPRTAEIEIKADDRSKTSWIGTSWIGRVCNAYKLTDEKKRHYQAARDQFCEAVVSECKDLFALPSQKEEAEKRARQVIKRQLADLYDVPGSPLDSDRAKAVYIQATAAAMEVAGNKSCTLSCHLSCPDATALDELPPLGLAEERAKKSKAAFFQIAKFTSGEEKVAQQRQREIDESYRLRIGKDVFKHLKWLEASSGIAEAITRRALSSSGDESPKEGVTSTKADVFFNCFNQASQLAFNDVSKDKYFWESDSRVVVRANNLQDNAVGSPALRLVLTDIPSDHQQISEFLRAENRVTNLMLKAYIQAVHGHLAVLELWAVGSTLDTLLKHGGAITQGAIKKAIGEAQGIQIRNYFSNTRWTHTENAPPPPRTTVWFQSHRVEENKAFFNKIAKDYRISGRYEGRIVPPAARRLSIKDSDLAKRIENKAAMLGLMDALEANRCDVAVCAYIWRKYFQADFATGSRKIDSQDVVKILAEAKALSHAKATGALDIRSNGKYYEVEEITLERADQDFKIWMNQTKVGGDTIARIASWLDGSFPKSEWSLKDGLDANRVNFHRDLLLDFAQYIAFRWGREAADEVWQTKLRERYTMGLPLEAGEMLVIVSELQKNSQNRLKKAEEAVEKYAKDVLRTSNANVVEFSLKEKGIDLLRENFRVKALSRVWQYGRALSEQELDSIVAESRKKFEPSDKRYSNEDGVKARLRKVDPLSFGAQMVSEQIVEYFKELDKDKTGAAFQGLETSTNILHFLRNAGNFGKYTYVADCAPGETWVERLVFWSKYYQASILTPEERKAFFRNHPEIITSDPQFIGAFASLFGIIIEARTLWRTIQADKEKANTIEVLASHYRLTLNLIEVCQHMIDHHDRYAKAEPVQGAKVPEKKDLMNLIDQAKGERDSAYNKLKAKLPVDYDLYVDNSQKARSIGAIGVGIIAGGASALFVKGTYPNWINSYVLEHPEWWTRDEFCLIVGNLGLDGVGLPALLNNARGGWLEWLSYLRSSKAEERAMSVLEPAFNEIVEKYKRAHNRKAKSFYTGDPNDIRYIRNCNRGKANEVKGQICETYLYYAEAKGKPKRLSARNLVTDDMKRDIAKAVVRGQKAGQHLFNTGIRATSTIGSIMCTASAMAMVGAEGGAIGGTFFSPFLSPLAVPICATLGGFGAAALGLITTALTFGSSEIRGRYVRWKNNKKTQEWLDAYVHHEGAKWNLVVKGLLKGRSPQELSKAERADLVKQAEEFAYRKLIRRDLNLAMTVLARDLHEEYMTGQKDGPAMAMLKNNFAPHKEEETLKDEKKFLENKHWDAFIDRIVSIGDMTLLQSVLTQALVMP